MTPDQIEPTLKEIFSTILGVEVSDIGPDLSPDTCSKWDSLHHIHIVTAIEQEFGVELSVEQQVEILTFDLAHEVVKEVLAA